MKGTHGLKKPTKSIGWKKGVSPSSRAFKRETARATSQKSKPERRKPEGFA